MVEKARPGRPAGHEVRYKTIAQDLERRLADGEWPDGTALPSCRQLARKYGVGAKTIWMALKTLDRAGRVRTRPRVQSVATRQVPLASVLDGAVAIAMKEPVSYFAGLDGSPTIGKGIFKCLSHSRRSILVLQHKRWWRLESPQGLRDAPVCGILIIGPFPPALIRQYESIGVPVVLLDQPPGDHQVHAVTVDNFGSAFDAASRLIALGHRRLAFVRSIVPNINNIDPDAKERQEGFLAACNKGGIAPGDIGVFSATFSAMSPALFDLVRVTPRYTAVLCAGSAHAPQMAQAAKAAGLKIPRDFSIATYHEMPSEDIEWSGPKIDFEEIGRIGAELVQDPPRTLQSIRVATVWQEGTTVAPPRR